jgi:hypothetical protein
VSKTAQTQVGRALGQLGIRHIAAYSPAARGRSERTFRTLQDRLPKELALAGITTVAAANRWFAKTYWPAHNATVAVAPVEAGCAFDPDRSGRVRDILCISRGTPGRQRQYRQMARSHRADPAEPAQAAFCARHRARARVPRRAPGDL